jgi:hypothetical protein
LSSIWPVNPISSPEKWKRSPSLWRCHLWPLLASSRAFPGRFFHRCGWQDLSPEETRNRWNSRLPVGGISICHRSIWCTTVSTTNTYKCNYENYCRSTHHQQWMEVHEERDCFSTWWRLRPSSVTRSFRQPSPRLLIF